MKKNILLLVLCAAVALPAMAKPALFTDPGSSYTRNNVTCTAGSLTGGEGALYSRQQIYSVTSFRKSNVATSAVAMTIDLTAAAQVTEPTKLLTFNSDHELGLMVTPEGITGNWHGKTWGETIPYAKLVNHSATLHRGGAHYISFTVVASGCKGAGWNGLGGMMGYDVNGELIVNLPLLASADNKEFRSIDANPAFVKTVSVNPEVSHSLPNVISQAAAQAAKVESKFLKSKGEWLSPKEWAYASILLLVILGGASITCFRKGRWA